MGSHSSELLNRSKIINTLDNVKGTLDSWSFQNLFFCLLFIRLKAPEQYREFVKKTLGRLESEVWKVKEEVKNFIRIRDNASANTRHFYDQKTGKWITKEVSNYGLFELASIDSIFSGLTDEEVGDKLIYLLRRIGDIDLSQEQDFGELYEFLIDQFGQRAGKSAGEFYTPRCLCELLFQIVDKLRPMKPTTTVYDPTSGTGTLLLMCRKMKHTKLMYYGQELNRRSFEFANLNMLAHDVNSFWLEHGDTLAKDKFSEEKFDVIVSNYPYGIRWDDKNADPARFPHGLAPPAKADYAFIQHMLNKLDWDGVCAVLCFPGILFRGNKEGLIRKSLIRTKLIRAVIHLPENLFYGNSIAAALIVFNRSRFEHTQNHEILFIDAKDAFRKQVKQNTMSQDVIEFIADLVANPKSSFHGRPPIGSNINWISKTIEEVLIEGDGSLCPSEYVETPEEPNIAYIPEEESRKRTIKTLEFLKHGFQLEQSAKRWFVETCKETDEFLEALDKYIRPLWEKYESEI